LLFAAYGTTLMLRSSDSNNLIVGQAILSNLNARALSSWIAALMNRRRRRTDSTVKRYVETASD
jgi:hypothetical protein